MHPPTDRLRRIGIAFAVLVIATLAATLWYGAYLEVQAGIVHHKTGGGTVRASEPVRFWIDIGLQITIGLSFAIVSLWLALGRRK